MKFFTSNVSILVLIFVTISNGSKAELYEHAQVKVTPSADEDDGFHVNIKKIDGDISMKLKKPEFSIFSSEFRFTVLEVGKNGENIFTDQTPSKEILDEIERNIYVDTRSNAVLKIDGGSKDGYKISGVVDNMKITHHKDDIHLMTPFETNSETRINDYIDLHRDDDESDASLQNPVPLSRQSVVTAQPEIFIIFDNSNYVQFGGNTAAITDYLSVFYRAINNRYATITNPKVVSVVVSVLGVSSRSAQPFIENAKINDGSNSYDMPKIVDDLSIWVHANRASLNGGKYDVVMLLSGEDFKSKNSSGSYLKGIAGIAYLGGACWTSGNTRFYGVSVNADKGGYWSGVLTAAHELAHNLNSSHDEEGGSKACKWADGYIMSYLGYGTKNKFYFSSCSQSSMRTFISSTRGACVRTYQSTTRWTPATQNPGDKIDMNVQCQKSLNDPTATVYLTNRTPQDICRNLKCRLGNYVYTMNRLPADSSPCGTNLVCFNGECVTKTTSNSG